MQRTSLLMFVILDCFFLILSLIITFKNKLQTYFILLYLFICSEDDNRNKSNNQ